jgi:4-amino-4-deoxy-L-arabinose transferase-like glycosyltransferase
LLLIGFGLRLFSLEGQSMWTDEGLSFYRSGQSPATIVQNIIVVDGIVTRDTNPPFYFLLLHFWRGLAGDTVFSMRFLTVAVATLSIPLMYVWGRRAFGYPAGLTAALFLAISPFHVWQSQIVRNYGLLLTLNLFSVYALYRFLFPNTNQPQRKWFLLWLAATLIGIYTHYFGFFIFAFGVTCLIISGLYRRGVYRLLRQPKWWLAAGLTALAVVPVTVIALDRFRAGQQVDFHFVPLPKFLHQAVSAFSVGMERSLVHEWWRIIPVVLLVFVGLWLGRRGRRQAVLFLGGYQIIPLGILYTLSFINPLYNGTRHLLIGLPSFLLLAAGGVALAFRNVGERPPQLPGRLRTAAVLALALFLLISQAVWLHSQFTSPRLVRDDVRGAAEYLNKVASPGDLIVLHDTLIRFTFDYYYHGPAPVTAVPEYSVLNPEQALATLREDGRRASRVWFLTEPQPRNGFDREMLSDWAADNWFTLDEWRFPAMWLPVNLVAYNSEPLLEGLPETVTPVDGNWPGHFNLQGAEIPATIYAGGDWWLAFYWNRTESGAPEAYEFSFRLTDMQGNLWNQWDERFQYETFLPANRPSQPLVRYHHLMEVPGGLPPGQYQLWLRLINREANQPVALADGSLDLHLTDVAAQSAACDSDVELWPPHTAAETNIGRAFTLRGFQLPEEAFRPGHGVPVQVLWCVRRPPDKDYLLRLQLIDEGGGMITESFDSLTRPDYPPTQWQKDQLLMSQAVVTVPAAAEAGTYKMQLSVVDPETKEPLAVGGLFGEETVLLGTVEIVAWPLVLEFPAIQTPVRADFGQPLIAELHGYELIPTQPQPGENLTLTLFWRGRSSAIPASYAVFVHLESEAGEIVAQGDGLPVSGFRPTTSWRDGEVIVDEHVVSIPAWAAPGSYRLWVGFYEPETNVRPEVLVDGVVQPDGRLLLTEIIIEP